MNYTTIEGAWSPLWATHFTEKDVRLRLKLGGENFEYSNEHIPRFLQAHQRASNVANPLFSGTCVAIVAWNGRPPYQAGLPDETQGGFHALQHNGFAAAQIGEWESVLYPAPDDEPDTWELRSYELSGDKVARDTLLWHAIASEMPICPSAPSVSFLLDPIDCVILQFYDHRGMDVIAVDLAKLHPLHDEFENWRLEYDRDRMAKLFSP